MSIRLPHLHCCQLPSRFSFARSTSGSGVSRSAREKHVYAGASLVSPAAPYRPRRGSQPRRGPGRQLTTCQGIDGLPGVLAQPIRSTNSNSRAPTVRGRGGAGDRWHAEASRVPSSQRWAALRSHVPRCQEKLSAGGDRVVNSPGSARRLAEGRGCTTGRGSARTLAHPGAAFGNRGKRCQLTVNPQPQSTQQERRCPAIPRWRRAPEASSTRARPASRAEGNG